MIPTGDLLYCANCRYTAKPQVLGRLLSTGELLILRFHSGTSLIKFENMELSCACGFTFLLNNGTIAGTIKMEV